MKVLFRAANVSYTDYIRTTEQRHKVAVQFLWVCDVNLIVTIDLRMLSNMPCSQKVLRDRGFIYKGYHEGWYSVSDEAFYPESQVEEVTGSDGKKYMVCLSFSIFTIAGRQLL